MSMPLVTKSLHDELSAQMLIYKSDDFAEFKRARAEGRPPIYLYYLTIGEGVAPLYDRKRLWTSPSARRWCASSIRW